MLSYEPNDNGQFLHECSKEFVTIYDEYAPHGYWDETVAFTPSKLAANLTTIENELSKLGEELKTGK